MPDKNEQSAPLLRRVIDKYLSAQLDFRVRLFNVLAVGGMLISLLSAVVSFAIGDHPIEYGTYLFFSLIALMLIIYSVKTGRYKRCYMITIVLIFLIGFPFFFFAGGGYYGAMTYFFVFAVIFTIFMLEGKQAIFMSAMELLLYISICVYDWINIPVDRKFLDADNMFVETVFGFSAVSAALGACLFIHFRLYNEQQKKLDEQNTVLAQSNRLKTEFLANTSHEMRTPLTVISVNVQTVMEILEDKSVNDPEAMKLLRSAQSEIMRLSRMVGGILTLASMSESTDRQRLDLTSLLNSGIEMLRLNLEKHGNAVETAIESGLNAFGNADLLAQVLSNILQNAEAHTQNGTITINAKRQGNEIIVTVRDTGTGVPPDILHRVFERGVSSGSTGYGLYLCKTVVESHGGKIWIESEQGIGTEVFYTLPYYEGQFGGAQV